MGGTESERYRTRTGVALFIGNDREKKYILECSRPDQDHLVMEGVADVVLRKPRRSTQDRKARRELL